MYMYIFGIHTTTICVYAYAHLMDAQHTPLILQFIVEVTD